MRPSSGFEKRDCPTCGRQTWHYHGTCSDHSAWPPAKRPTVQVERHITIVADLHRQSKGKGRRRGALPPRQLRVQRTCGCWTEHAELHLCPTCLDFLASTECPSHAGRALPLPPCACHATYRVDAAVGVLMHCAYCADEMPAWGAPDALLGRWVWKETVLHHLNGDDEVVRKRLLTLRKGKVCSLCFDAWASAQQRAGINPTTGERRRAYLDLSLSVGERRALLGDRHGAD